MSFSPPMHEPPYAPPRLGEALAEAVSAAYAPSHREDLTLTRRLTRCAAALDRMSNDEIRATRAQVLINDLAELLGDLENEVGA